MKVTPDTNVLVRAVMNDDTDQAEAARRCLTEADQILLTLPALCEAAWVLKSYYGASRQEVALAIRSLTGASNAVFDTLAVAMGLGLLDGGGDFADGVIAADGIGMGADVFASFDRNALRQLGAAGVPVVSPN